jgi:hypothetical protein
LAPRIDHRPLGGEHVELVDREADAEFLALAVVPAQRDRLAGCERPTFGAPRGAGVGQLDGISGLARANPAELRELLRGRARRREQPHRARILLDRLAVGLEHDVVDPRADEVDRAGDLGRVDRDATRRGERGRQVARLLGHFARVGQPPFASVLDRCGLRRALCLDGRPLVWRRCRVELADREVETEQQRKAQHDGEDEVTLVVQDAILSEMSERPLQGTGS